MAKSTTDEWELYAKSKDYKQNIGLYDTADTNERMFAGDQWYGVKSNGLPTPVFNIFKRVINYFISAIMSQAVKMQFIPENIADDPTNPEDQELAAAAGLMSKYSETLWEKLKMDSRLREALLDAAISGDMDGYTYWNPNIKTGQTVEGVEIMGDIDFELVDNVNVHFGNPNDPRVERQPWIIISFRELVSKLKDEAKSHGVPKREYDLIGSDQETNTQSGDRAKIELDSGEDGKTTALIKFWRDKETGTIRYKKSTKTVTIIPETNIGIERYPVAHGNWDRRKNSYHGQAVGTGLIPNQVFINKMFAMVMLNMMNVAFPKAIYNAAIIQNWSNQVGQAIPVTSADDIHKVATYLQPGNMANHVMEVIAAAINYTKDLMGVTDAAMGNVKPDNHAAIIAVQQASFVPLETIKANLYQWVEDIGYIWLDFMIAKYGTRTITIDNKGKRETVEVQFDRLKGKKFRLKVEVGPSSFWSEISSMQTLDNLLRDARIDFVQYLERVPAGMIPKKEELIGEIKAKMAQPPQPPPINPNLNVAFEDLPPSAKAQACTAMGFQVQPQEFVEKEVVENQVEMSMVQQEAQAKAIAKQGVAY